MICDTCVKRKKRGPWYECMVLAPPEPRDRAKKHKLPLWGENCSAYTNDPDWEEKTNAAVKLYKLKQKEKSLCNVSGAT